MGVHSIYIGPTFKRATCLEAQARHHEHLYGYRNLGVRLKKAVRLTGENLVKCDNTEAKKTLQDEVSCQRRQILLTPNKIKTKNSVH